MRNHIEAESTLVVVLRGPEELDYSSRVFGLGL